MPAPGPLDLANVQGDILTGFTKKFEIFTFFEIIDSKAFCPKLKQVASELSHTANSSTTKSQLKGRANKIEIVPIAEANMAFSFAGLQKVRLLSLTKKAR